MSARSPAERRVVVGVDGSEGARHALRWSIGEAELRGATLEAVLVWRYPPTIAIPVAPVIPSTDLQRPSRALLDEEIAMVLAERPTGVPIEATVLEGPPARRLFETAADADLLVVGARGFGVAAVFGLGSVVQQCVHHATVPVAIVRDDVAARRAKGRIVVGVDGSDGSRRALRWAADEARRRGATLDVVMAWSLLDQPVSDDDERTSDQADAERVLDEILDGHPAESEGVELLRTVVCEGPVQALVAAGDAADIVVVGARGLGGFKRLALGSVSHHVAQRATGPVVIVPHRGGGADEQADRTLAMVT